MEGCSYNTAKFFIQKHIFDLVANDRGYQPHHSVKTSPITLTSIKHLVHYQMFYPHHQPLSVDQILPSPTNHQIYFTFGCLLVTASCPSTPFSCYSFLSAFWPLTLSGWLSSAFSCNVHFHPTSFINSSLSTAPQSS